MITKITNFNKVRCMQNNIYFQATTIINYNLSLSKWKTKYNINKHFSNVTFGRQNIYKSLLLNRSKDFWLGTKVLPRVDSLLSFDPSISPITSSISWATVVNWGCHDAIIVQLWCGCYGMTWRWFKRGKMKAIASYYVHLSSIVVWLCSHSDVE